MNAFPRGATLFVVASLAISALLSIVTLTTPSARAASNVDVCGNIGAYVKPTALTVGAITIGGTPWVLAAGSDITGEAAGDIEAGAHLCFHLTINANGSITELAAVSADASSTLKICGVVTALDESTSLTTGDVAIGDTVLTLAAGADLPASVHVGADLCAKFKLNGFGQVNDADISANATSNVEVCGVVHGLEKASVSHTGELAMADQDFVLALGTDLPAEIKEGADLCATLELNGFGQVTDGQVEGGANATVTVCGRVDAYAAATSNNDGELDIGGIDRTIKAGTDVDSRVEAGAYVKLRLTLNANAKITDVAVVRIAGSLADACGSGEPASPPPTNGPTAAPTATPQTPGGPTPPPTPITPGGPTPTPVTPGGPTPTPETPGGPTPVPTAETPGGPTPIPTAETPGGPAPTPSGDVCGPDGNGVASSGSGSNSAPDLPSAASPIQRASQVVAIAAVPSLVFGALLVLGSVAAWSRRRAAPNLVATEGVEQ